MKKILIVLIAAISFNAGNVSQAQVMGGISFNTFYDELRPYGRWIEDPQYGQIWLSSQQGFEPYYDNGHWVFTSYGWTWISDYPWGWAPFHYGRWAFTSYGWAWVPGYEWAPAWVGWCQNDGYYGWAPLSPGLGFNISFNNIPRDRWRFVQQQYITSPVIFNHYIRPDRNANVYRNITIINNTQTINNNTYVAGPKREEVERVTRKKIEPKQVAFNETTQKTTEEKTQVKMYRPDVKLNQEAGNTMPVNINKEEKKNSVLLQEPNKNNPAATSQGNIQPALRDQQKVVQSSTLQRQREERLKQDQYNQPLPPQLGTQKENERHQQVIQQGIERQDAIKQQIFQQQQERIREQKIQKQNNQEQWNQQQQNLQLQKELRQKKMQEQQALQQQREQQQNEQQQNEMRQQREQQNEMRQQKEKQNEMRQQKEKPQPPNPPSTLDERKPEQKNKNPF